MKKLLLYSFAVLFILSGCKSIENKAQNNKAYNSISAEQTAANAVQAIKNQNFVLEANYIYSRTGQSIFVNSNTNFISVNGNKATVQLALSSQFSGPNGIGGITLDGTISNPKVTIDKKGVLNYTMSVQGIGISATVTFTMPSGTNSCTATVIPNFSGNNITFSGYVVPTAESSVFKGTSF